ncbi:MAG: DMT family transporter [Rhodobacteraceae bacterium]|nr:DMT family transporter [Paracoccaceae bacterium]
MDTPDPRQARRGIAYMLAAILVFTAMDAVAKHLTMHYPAMQTVWARYFIPATGIVLWLALRRGFGAALRTRRPGLQALRSVLQLATTLIYFAALARMGLVEAAAIAETSPVLITLFAALFLGERIGPRRIAGIAVALAGAMIVIRPGTEVFSPWAFLPLAAAATYAGYAVATRSLGPEESLAGSLLWTSGLGMVVTTAMLPWIWQPVAPGDAWAFGLIGVLGGVAQIFFVRAFTLAEASAIAPFGYVGLVFAAFWGFVAFGEVPDIWTILGALVIAAAGIYVWHRETRGTGTKPP